MIIMPDLSSRISKHFIWKEALWMRNWGRAANEIDGLNEEILRNLKTTFFVMDEIREYFMYPVIVHDAYRPPDYNDAVGGAKNSPHLYGLACDFHVHDLSCDVVREKIVKEGMLDRWSCRMEKLPTGSPWVHIDLREPGPAGRYFRP